MVFGFVLNLEAMELAEVIHSDNDSTIHSNFTKWIIDPHTLSSGDVELSGGGEDFLHDRLRCRVLVLR